MGGWARDRTKGWVETSNVREEGGNDPVESAIAEQYANYYQGKAVEGQTATLFQRIKDFFERLKNLFTGHGFQTAEDVFEDIYKGEMRRRYEAPIRARIDELNRKIEEMSPSVKAAYLQAAEEVSRGPTLTEIAEQRRIARNNQSDRALSQQVTTADADTTQNATVSGSKQSIAEPPRRSSDLLRRAENHPIASGIAIFFICMIVLAPLTAPTKCRDGWPSPSIGRRGACSWHGGVDGTLRSLGDLVSLAAGFVSWFALARRNDKSEMFSSLDSPQPRTEPYIGPYCPKCGAQMKRRISQKWRHAGKEFFGCANSPRCNGLRKIEPVK